MRDLVADTVWRDTLVWETHQGHTRGQHSVKDQFMSDSSQRDTRAETLGEGDPTWVSHGERA
jgi:hypothetical protein